MLDFDCHLGNKSEKNCFYLPLPFLIEGAKADSWNLYPQVKGKVEEELKTMGFDRYFSFKSNKPLSSWQSWIVKIATQTFSI